MMHHTYSVEKTDGGWAVLHRGKTLAAHPTREAAEAHVERLARLTQASGHNAEVVVEDETGQVVSDEVYRRLR